MVELLARLGENAFWAARYVERVESLARLLQVNDTSGRDRMGRAAWGRIVDINGDRAAFAERASSPSRAAVCGFYLFDETNPASALSALGAARANIRALRHLVSTELWRQINVFHKDFRENAEARFAADGLSAFCAHIRFNAQALYGIVDGTLYRDDAYGFYMVGRYVEMADQITRILDANLLGREVSAVTEAEARAQWQAVLRSVGGSQAFKRVAAHDLSHDDVVHFLIGNDAFPRSFAHSIDGLHRQFLRMRVVADLPADAQVMELVDLLRAMAREIKPQKAGMREKLDAMQRALMDLTARTSQAYFA